MLATGRAGRGQPAAINCRRPSALRAESEGVGFPSGQGAGVLKQRATDPHLALESPTPDREGEKIRTALTHKVRAAGPAGLNHDRPAVEKTPRNEHRHRAPRSLKRCARAASARAQAGGGALRRAGSPPSCFRIFGSTAVESMSALRASRLASAATAPRSSARGRGCCAADARFPSAALAAQRSARLLPALRNRWRAQRDGAPRRSGGRGSARAFIKALAPRSPGVPETSLQVPIPPSAAGAPLRPSRQQRKVIARRSGAGAGRRFAPKRRRGRGAPTSAPSQGPLERRPRHRRGPSTRTALQGPPRWCPPKPRAAPSADLKRKRPPDPSPNSISGTRKASETQPERPRSPAQARISPSPISRNFGRA